MQTCIFAASSKRFIGIEAFGICLQIVDHGVAHGVGEGRLLPPEDIVRQDMIVRERLTQEVFAHVIRVQLQLRTDGHDVFYKIQIAERDSGFERVDGNAAVGAQDIVHIKLVHALFASCWKASALGAKSVYL